MSPPSPNKIAHATTKHNTSSFRPTKKQNAKANVKKAIVSHPLSSLPFNDFTLYPDDAVVDKSSSDRRARAQRVKKELISDGLLLSTNEDDDEGREKVTVVQRAAKRRAKTESSPNVHQSREALQDGGVKLPPAPSPPRLGTPDLDETDKELWSCCYWDEGSVKSYIGATKSPHERSTKR